MNQSNRPLTPENLNNAGLKTLFGIFISLLAIIALLNRFIGAYFSYGLIYLFGDFYFVFLGYVIFLGILLMFNTKPAFRQSSLALVGFMFVFFGLLITGSIKQFPTLSISQIHPMLEALLGPIAEAITEPINIFNGSVGGGFFGSFLTAIFASFLTVDFIKVLVILLYVAGGILLLRKVFVAAFHYFAKKIKEVRAHRQFFKDAATLDEETFEAIYRRKPVDEPVIIPNAKAKPLDAKGKLQKAKFEGATPSIDRVVPVTPIARPVDQPREVKPILDSTAYHFEPKEVVTPKPEVRSTTVTPVTRQNTEEVFAQPVRQEIKPIRTLETTKKPAVTHIQYAYPPLDLLENYETAKSEEKNIAVAERRIEEINNIFQDLSIGANVISYTIGPAVTRYDVQTDRSVTISSVTKVIQDISIRLGGLTSRFQEIVRGKSTSGLEIPNAVITTVGFKEVFKSLPNGPKDRLLIPFGKDISGDIISANIEDFPHLLVAGATGSGKSIFVHSFVMTLIMRNTPDELKLLIIDPKRVEMARYKELPHLLCPIITDNSKAKVALDKLVVEMERRYDLFEQTSSSKISQYNEYAEEQGLEKMPIIIVIIDEYADLVDSVKEISSPVIRLAQKSRAAGIHLVISTQRPSVNVITGTIKANLPTRVALMVASPTDSVTILGEGGAEKLLGNGDMLVECAKVSRQGTTRVQGCYVDNKEIRRVVDFLATRYASHYHPDFLDLTDKTYAGAEYPGPRYNDQIDPVFYNEVKNYVMTCEYISMNSLMNRYNAGFKKINQVFMKLKEEGIIASDNEPNSNKGAKVLQRTPLSPEEQAIERNDY